MKLNQILNNIDYTKLSSIIPKIKSWNEFLIINSKTPIFSHYSGEMKNTMEYNCFNTISFLRNQPILILKEAYYIDPYTNFKVHRKFSRSLNNNFIEKMESYGFIFFNQYLIYLNVDFKIDNEKTIINLNI